jgi:hypothetical protein
MAAVQFFGVGPVVNAYEVYGIPCWAIVSKREVVFAGEGADDLRSRLELFGPSVAEYTLRMYRDCEDHESINRSTDFDRSFNFKLTEAMGGMGMVSRAGYGGPGGDPIMGAVYQKFSQRVAAAVERELDGGNDAPETFLEGIQGFITKSPDKAIELLNGLRGLFTPAGASGMPMATMAGLGGNVTRAGGPRVKGMDPEAKLQRLGNAIDRLEKRDPDLVENLEKLADLAEKNPQMYKMAIMQLNSL